MPRLPATNVGTGPDGKPIFRPIIVVSIDIGGRLVRGTAIVDSGADNTLVPFDAVAPLGVEFLKLPPGPGGAGPGGSLDVRLCKGVLRWDKRVLMTEFMVAEPKKGPDAILLRRADFFTLYVVRFQWHKNPPTFDLDPVGKAK